MVDLIKPWQERHFGRQHRIFECKVTAIGKDAAGIHTLMVDVVKNNQRLPFKILTRLDILPQGLPPGFILVGNILEILFATIDDAGRIPVVTPVEILNKTHEGGDIFNFKTGKVYDSYHRSKVFDPWQDYLNDMEALNRGGE
jgi:hypothetical protein